MSTYASAIPEGLAICAVSVSAMAHAVFFKVNPVNVPDHDAVRPSSGISSVSLRTEPWKRGFEVMGRRMR